MSLEKLVDILDDIVPEEEEEQALFSEEEETDIINTCMLLMNDYVDEHTTAITEPDFHESMLSDVKTLLFMHFESFFGIHDEMEDGIDSLIDIAAELFYTHIIPKRSHVDTFEKKKTEQKQTRIKERLEHLATIPQSSQRTKEWYETRHKLITASNAYKVFENENTRNQLIYEKCQPLSIDVSNEVKFEQVNTTTAMHWGQKYEPVSILYYESLFQTKVSEYGCIPHDTYDFLGASPDGIVSDPLLPRFGRMLEIKNIVNRDIDGIPKKEYWIQMQLQMETCDLDECDFLETRFIEYAGYTEFQADGNFLMDSNEKHKGIILFFTCSTTGKPVYCYKPLHMQEDYFNDVWEPEQLAEQQALGRTWVKNIYWRMDEVSCVLVMRNKKWFHDNVHVLIDTWNTILKERITGCDHRAPNKRSSKKEIVTNDSVCLITLNKESGKVVIQNSNPQPIIQVIRIRTESMDETKQKASSGK